jgi:putative hydrolase of the HAD superfamily
VRSKRVIFWDFDRTLAYRPRGWSGTMLDILLEVEPNSRLTRDHFAPFTNEGFPWDTPEIPHPELVTADLWWQRIEVLIARGYLGVGLDQETAHLLARRFRARYLDLAGWIVYDDVHSTLTKLVDLGWRHIIVSNHIPELPELVDALGLGSLIEAVITSARVAYEKPNKEIFRIAQTLAGTPEVCWMVGDNPVADVLGAESAGIKGILVRSSHHKVARSCIDLNGVVDIVEREAR